MKICELESDCFLPKTLQVFFFEFKTSVCLLLFLAFFFFLFFFRIDGFTVLTRLFVIFLFLIFFFLIFLFLILICVI